jgi:hypothetical protein
MDQRPSSLMAEADESERVYSLPLAALWLATGPGSSPLDRHLVNSY